MKPNHWLQFGKRDRADACHRCQARTKLAPATWAPWQRLRGERIDQRGRLFPRILTLWALAGSSLGSVIVRTPSWQSALI